MRHIYLIRHAKSCWEDPSLGDKERPLNPRGHRDAPFMAAHLAELGVQPDLIISSTAKRTLTTASYFAKQFGIAEENILFENDLYDARVAEVMNVIRAIDDEHKVVLLIGHNPAMTYLANMFGGDRIDNVPTCGIVRLDFSGENWSGFHEENAQQGLFVAPKLLVK